MVRELRNMSCGSTPIFVVMTVLEGKLLQIFWFCYVIPTFHYTGNYISFGVYATEVILVTLNCRYSQPKSSLETRVLKNYHIKLV